MWFGGHFSDPLWDLLETLWLENSFAWLPAAMKGCSKAGAKRIVSMGAQFWQCQSELLGSILVRFWYLFCSNFGPRSLLDTHLHQKHRCSRKPLKTHEKSLFSNSRRLRIYNCFKSFLVSMNSFFLTSVLTSIWPPFWLCFDSILAPFGGYVGPLAPFRAAFFTFFRFSDNILKIFDRLCFILGELFVLQRASGSFAETGS